MYDFEIEEDMKEIFSTLEDKICESENEFFDDDETYSEEFTSGYIDGYKNGIEMAMTILKEYGYSDEMKNEEKTKHYEEEDSKLDDFIIDELFDIIHEELNDFQTVQVGQYFIINARDRLKHDLENEKILEEYNKLDTIVTMLQKILENYV